MALDKNESVVKAQNSSAVFSHRVIAREGRSGGYGAGIDPYGTWNEQVPKGVQVFPSSITGIPNGSGCTYGSGSCGGMIYGITLGSAGSLYRPPTFNSTEFLFWLLQSARSNMSSAGKQLIQQQRDIRDQCVARADAEQARMNSRTDNATGSPAALPVQEPLDPEDAPVGPSFEPPADTSAGQFLFGRAIDSVMHRLAVKDCISRTPIPGLP